MLNKIGATKKEVSHRRMIKDALRVLIGRTTFLFLGG